MVSNNVRSKVQWINSAGMPLIRVKPGPDLAVVIVGPLVNCYVHWMQELDRTQACFVFRCPACDEGIQRRPMTYIGVLHFRMYAERMQWLPAILEVPFRAGQVLADLKGKRVALNRSRKCSTVNIGTYLFDDEPPKPSHIEFMPQLLSLWRVPDSRQIALVGNRGPQND